MRIHLGHKYFPPEVYDRAVTEDAGDKFAVDDRDVAEQAPYCDDPVMEELKGMDLFNAVRAAPPDPTGEAMAVRGDNLPWEGGKHPALG